jgi:serine/threonine protein kinase
MLNSRNKEEYNSLLKYGSCSIILGKHHYAGHFPEKLNKVLKVTKQFCGHDEQRYENIIRSIDNNDSYYVIPETALKELTPTSPFYRYLKNMFEKRGVTIFTTTLSCFYVEYAGSMDVLESIEKMCNDRDNTIWKSHDSILNFANHIIKGLAYLHKKKIAHLDIKPENIMIDSRNPSNIKFRIIDFGFSSMEPFNEFISNIRGTPGYFPKYFKGQYEPALPTVKANDMDIDPKTDAIPMKTNPALVYKIDSYCLGRTLNYMLYHYNATFNPRSCCHLFRKKNIMHDKLKKLIDDLTINDVYVRPFIITLVAKSSKEKTSIV